MNPVIRLFSGSKALPLLFSCMSFALISNGQLKAKAVCPEFNVNLLDGTVNGLKADRTPNEIKEKFPCFTSASDDGAGTKCGGTINFKDRDIIFYTERDYVEIGPKFKGRLSIPLLGAKRNTLFKWLGNPKMKDDKWDAFETAYGVLILRYDATGKVILIQFSTKSTDNISLCE